VYRDESGVARAFELVPVPARSLLRTPIGIFQWRLRSSILEELNRALVKASEHLGFDGRLRVERLPTLALIEECFEALEQGTGTLDDVFRRLSFTR